MNHDETNSNPNPEMQTWIDPTLEARVVAWVAGEASAFEIAELERLVAEKPELAIFKRRIEAVNGLVAEAARPDKAPLRLSDERRAKVLATIAAAGGVPVASGARKIVVMPEAKKASRWSWRTPQIYFALSGAVAAGLIAVFLVPGQMVVYKKAGRQDPAMPVALSMPLPEQSNAPKASEPIGVTFNSLSAPAIAPSFGQAGGAGRFIEGEAKAVPRKDGMRLVTDQGVSVADVRAEPPVKLDVFEVSAARDMGYAASSISAASTRPVDAPGLSDQLAKVDTSPLRMGIFDATLAGSAVRSDAARTSDEKVVANNQLQFVTNGSAIPADKKSEGVYGPVSRFGSVVEMDSVRSSSGAIAVNPQSRTNAVAGNEVWKGATTPATTPPALQPFRGYGGSLVTGGAPSSPVTFGTVELNSAKPLATSDQSSIVLGASSIAGGIGGTITLGQDPRASQETVAGGIGGAVQAKEESIVLSPFTITGSKQKDADRIATGTVIQEENRQAQISSTSQELAKRRAAEAQVKASADTEAVTLQEFRVSGVALDDAKNKLASANERLKKLREERAQALQVARLEREREAPAPVSAPAPVAIKDEISAAKDAVSTFSLHVSDVSFRLAVAATAAFERGENPKLPEIRAEEFYNAFNYGDPAPAVSEKIGARIEQAVHPVLQQRNLLRIAMKVPASGRGAGQPLRLTVLLDTSGSMEREDRRLSVRRALEELIALLGPNDRVTLVGFARQPRLLAEAVPGNQAGQLVELSARTPAEGGTNLEAALKLAGELALRHRMERAQNRIVLLTDGAANLGNADPAKLATAVETLRQQGIAFDACGIGLEGIGDTVLEALTRKGDGRYYVIERPEAADAAFARQLAGAFRPAAENVKLQVRFNPARVGNYRLIGFEQHRLREQDFRNDKVDAAELAAEEGATALYQIEMLPQGSGEVGEVFVRFRDAATGAMVERSWTIRYDAQAPRFNRATPSLQLAGVAALLAEKLGETPLAGQFKLGDYAGVVNGLRSHYAHEPRVQELVTMFGRLRRIRGE